MHGAGFFILQHPFSTVTAAAVSTVLYVSGDVIIAPVINTWRKTIRLNNAVCLAPRKTRYYINTYLKIVINDSSTRSGVYYLKSISIYIDVNPQTLIAMIYILIPVRIEKQIIKIVLYKTAKTILYHDYDILEIINKNNKYNTIRVIIKYYYLYYFIFWHRIDSLLQQRAVTEICAIPDGAAMLFFGDLQVKNNCIQVSPLPLLFLYQNEENRMYNIVFVQHVIHRDRSQSLKTINPSGVYMRRNG